MLLFLACYSSSLLLIQLLLIQILSESIYVLLLSLEGLSFKIYQTWRLWCRIMQVLCGVFCICRLGHDWQPGLLKRKSLALLSIQATFLSSFPSLLLKAQADLTDWQKELQTHPLSFLLHFKTTGKRETSKEYEVRGLF